MKTIYIHAGFHKTGTTSLQHSLSASRAMLLQHGIEYPIVGQGNSQNSSVLALAGRGWGWANRGSKALPFSVWKKLVKEIRKSKNSCVISSEFLSELDETALSRLKHDFHDYDIKIVFTIRSMDKLMPSTYQQALKSGNSTSYEDWLANIIADYWGARKTAFWKRNEHAIVLSRWIAKFGPDRVALMTVNESEPTKLFSRFSAFLGIPDGVIVRGTPTGLNRGLYLDEIALLLQLNANFPKSSHWNEYLTFVRKGVFEFLTNYRDDKISPKLILSNPPSLKNEILKISEEQLSELRKLDIEIIGSLEELKFGSSRFAKNQLPTNLDLEKISKVLQNFNFGLLSNIAPRYLVSYGVPYLEHRIPEFFYKPLLAIVRKFAKLKT